MMVTDMRESSGQIRHFFGGRKDLWFLQQIVLIKSPPKALWMISGGIPEESFLFSWTRQKTASPIHQGCRYRISSPETRMGGKPFLPI